MRQNILAGAELFFLAGLETRPGDLLGLGFEQVPFRGAASRATHGLSLSSFQALAKPA